MRKFGIRLLAAIAASSLIVTPVLAAPSVDELEKDKAAAQSEVESLQQQLTATLEKLDELETNLIAKGEEITQAEEDLKKAEEKEQQQYDDMKLRIKYMYESGAESYLSVLVSATDFSDFVNKAEYVQKVHDYDRNMLDEYVATKNEIKDLKVDLEAGQADMQVMATEMENQRSNLESTLTEMESQIADFDDQLAAAREAAAAQLEELNNQTETPASDQVIESVAGNTGGGSSSGNSGSNSSGSSSGSSGATSGSSSGSSGGSSDSGSSSGGSSSASKPSNASLGQQIANKGCEYIGNKYVYGGNSLTNGIDCSGFVYQIHKLFGITTPRTSSALRSGGKAVSWDDKLPGDVICYSGHVAIYIGNNTIVHASNSAPYPAGGIKTTSPANYKTVLAVRRYW